MALAIVSTPSQIGAVVREHRKRAGLTLADLAQVLGVSISGLSNIEKGIVRPSVAALFAICGALGISLWIEPNPPDHC